MSNNAYPDGVVIPNAHQYDRKGWGAGGEGEPANNRVMPANMPGPGIGAHTGWSFGSVAVMTLAVVGGLVLLGALMRSEKARPR